MKFLVLLAMSGSAYAAGDGHGSPMDLIAPAVNLSILLGFLAYKLKGPVREMFVSKSASVSEMIERASVKAKEAEMMMKVQTDKMKGAEQEVAKLNEETAEELKSFEASYKEEVQSRVKAMREDAGQKIEAEKKELLDDLNSNLLSLVIEKTKTTLKTDKALADNAAKSIIEGLK